MNTQVADPQAILQAWTPFRQLLGVACVRTPDDHQRALAVIDVLLGEVGEDENHPLAEVLDYLANQVKSYEDENTVIPQAPPAEVLRFLMDQHGLTQGDLADCAPQGRISDILRGRRAISREMARRLAERFGVRPDVFM